MIISNSVPIVQPLEQSPESMDLAMKRNVLAAENLIMERKLRALELKKRSLVSEILAKGEKSKALATKRTLFVIESLILEDKSKDLAVERITLALKRKPWQSNYGDWLSDIL